MIYVIMITNLKFEIKVILLIDLFFYKFIKSLNLKLLLYQKKNGNLYNNTYTYLNKLDDINKILL